MVRALEAAHAAAQRVSGGREALAECLGLMLDEMGAGGPRWEALGDMREDAAWWAHAATPDEIEVYAAAALRRIKRATFATSARKRLLVALWQTLTPDEKRAFMDKHGSKG